MASMARPLTRVFAVALLAAAPACDRSSAVCTADPDQAPLAEDLGEAAPTLEDGEEDPAAWVAAHYRKQEHRIPMRDGKTLFTAVYTPREAPGPLPIMLMRTPYSVGPYGEDQYPKQLGLNPQMMRDGYIFAFQDVRGRFMSEGEFVDVRPFADGDGPAPITEASDTHDTIAWLLEHVDGHNGRVGQWGISYPGFYAAAALVDPHPALVAVSPQAPIADWWYDDFHHHGAFLLPHLFNFIASFGVARPELTQSWPPRFDHGTPDGFAFFMDLASARYANERYFHHELAFWDQVLAHPNYDEFWQQRNLLPHLEAQRSAAPAVMTVGGWFDAEDLYGPLHIYAALERPETSNTLVMGPWQHGGWSRTTGDHLGDVHFGSETSRDYQAEVERRFFASRLQHPSAAEYEGCEALPEAYVFETGANQWRRFEQWPPAGDERSLWLGAGSLEAAAPTTKRGFDEFVSDPAHPVPFSTVVAKGMTREYMTDDQRFAARRGDVLVYQSEALTEALTIAGPLSASLWVSTNQRDADWIVKLIDVFPDDAPDPEGLRETVHMGGYQMMVRSEVLRGRFREDPSRPEPFTPNRPTEVEIPLQDVLHTFLPGHRVMIQIQSSWFPLVDRNPQAWVDNIYLAERDDFVAATHRVYREARHASRLRFQTLAPGADQRLRCL